MLSAKVGVVVGAVPGAVVGPAGGHVKAAHAPSLPQFVMATNSASQSPHSGQASNAPHV